MIVLLCVFADINEWHKMELFAKTNESTFKKLLYLPNGIPSHDTLQRVFALLNPNELTNLLVPLFIDIVNNGLNKLNIEDNHIYKDEDLEIKDIYNFDGKEIRKNGDKYKSGEDSKNFNTLNVYSTEYQLVLRAERINSKTNEISTMAKALKYLDLKGVIATFDTLNTQKQVIEAIVKVRGDYVGVLKKNHETFYGELELYFNDKEFLSKIKTKGN